MFHYDDGLVITRPRVAVDFRRRAARGFISHAHMDHMARHALALCTPATAALYRHRLGARLAVKEMPYGEPLEIHGARLTAMPAGHCLGSAMLLVEQDGKRLLYTGDFKLGDSHTAAPADPPKADVLIIESTFGRPEYRLPPRAEVERRLLEIVHQAFEEGCTPVIHAYALGKSQEVTKLLTTAGVPVLQHPKIYAVSRVYAECGMELSTRLATGRATCSEYGGRPLAGHAVVTLPRQMKQFRLRGLGDVTSIAVTGWAAHRSTRHRLRVDHALPLSDHADFDQLLETARCVAAEQIYCTHGPPGLAEHLTTAGFNAQALVPDSQRRLF